MIGIFQYFEQDTLIHRLDPRTKFAWLAAVTLLAIILHRPDLLVLLFSLTLVPVLFARIPLRQLGLIFSFYAFIFFGTTLSQALFYSPSVGGDFEALFWVITPDFPLIGAATGGVPFTIEGAVHGFIQAFRILAMLNASVTLVMTTSMNRMIVGLRELGLPHTLTFMLTTAVRFVPTIIEEYTMITRALRARGISKGSVRIVEYSMAPLILNSVRRCNQLALAAESRAFGSEAVRTSYTALVFSRSDAACTAAIGALFVVLILLGVAG